MLIVNQNKDLVINLSNVLGIQTEGTDIGVAFVNGDSLILGEYKTEERAKEVLMNIYKTYSDETLIKCVNETIQNQLIAEDPNEIFDVYEMPKE